MKYHVPAMREVELPDWITVSYSTTQGGTHMGKWVCQRCPNSEVIILSSPGLVFSFHETYEVVLGAENHYLTRHTRPDRR